MDNFERASVNENRALNLFIYYVYFIKNRKEKKFYIGCTKDLKRRLLEHQDKMLTIENKN